MRRDVPGNPSIIDVDSASLTGRPTRAASAVGSRRARGRCSAGVAPAAPGWVRRLTGRPKTRTPARGVPRLVQVRSADRARGKRGLRVGAARWPGSGGSKPAQSPTCRGVSKAESAADPRSGPQPIRTGTGRLRGNWTRTAATRLLASAQRRGDAEVLARMRGDDARTALAKLPQFADGRQCSTGFDRPAPQGSHLMGLNPAARAG